MPACCWRRARTPSPSPARPCSRARTVRYVYVVKPDQTAELRSVHVAQISDGQALIDQGLKSGEIVVVDGQYRLKEGSRVQQLHGKAAREADLQSAVQDAIP